jgi:hypothetical protein
MSKNVEPGQQVYIAKINKNDVYALPVVTEPWRANAYYNFMITNGKPKDGKVYTHHGYKVKLLPWDTDDFPSFCISQNEEGLQHILSNDEKKLKDYIATHNRIWTSGGNRKKSRTKRNKRTKRTKRIHSIKRK